MKQLLLILSLNLGLANPVFAVSRAAEVIANGRILLSHFYSSGYEQIAVNIIHKIDLT